MTTKQGDAQRQWHDVDAVQRLVLSFLGPMDLVRMSSLNRSFHRSARHSPRLNLSSDINMELGCTGYDRLVPYFRHARVLDVCMSFALPDELLHLTSFRHLEDVSLVDVASLSDYHLSALTCHAMHLKRLRVDGCHELVSPSLHLAHATTLDVSNNLHLQRLPIHGRAGFLTELRVSSCPAFVAFNTIMAAAPNVQTADFAQSNGLVRFHCRRAWLHLRSLVLVRCAQLAMLEVEAPTLTSIRVDLCVRLEAIVLSTDSLPTANFSLLPALQSLYLDCPRLTRLNVTGSTALQPSGVMLECPLLTSKKFQRDGVPSLVDILRQND
ncbi:hypothetical protein H310_07375 [Aphanomyces invadans]|uniref:F-box domain-containing protein n=1 Tax=Aphanomyces invadans TaxID=157072 RepID=A0A024U3M8_9STRA|nr:hypothetical protein H310_07375 [Aphanomyces invadans]ETW00849.1 hypothetical protein H310_07375 [Aphanomyces invadans]|eukprot:XP_008870984.1 hypothetical protein H310_07375 [Aphanomyces invadans]